MASAPASRTARAVASASSAERAKFTTTACAPASAAPTARALPRPDEAPVTVTIMPS